MSVKIDMIGYSFKNWQVIEFVDNTKNSRSARWKCKCQECGIEKIFVGSEIRLDRVAACKHKPKQDKVLKEQKILVIDGKELNSQIKNELGNTYNFLTVIGFEGTKNSFAFWKCRCKCGREVVVRGNHLRSNKVKSCGCLNSYKELLIQNILNNHNITYKKEYSFEDLKDQKNLRFDFAVFKDNKLFGLIEYQGQQHYEESSPFNHYGLLQIHDEMKIEYCKRNNIKLLILNKSSELEKDILKWFNN